MSFNPAWPESKTLHMKTETYYISFLPFSELNFILAALVDVDEPTKDDKVIDIYAIGFEEMVDLDAKNIMNASKENAKEWALELGKTLNRDHKYCMVTFHQLVGVCLYVFVRVDLASKIR